MRFYNNSHQLFLGIGLHASHYNTCIVGDLGDIPRETKSELSWVYS
jgi:hypothetical protein